MRNFFKIFFAALLALVVFTILLTIFLVGFVGGISTKEKPRLAASSILVIDLAQSFPEQMRESPLDFVSSEIRDVPGLYDVIRLVKSAKTDKKIAGIYLLANNNPNGFAASQEIRAALQDFRSSGKILIAFGDVMTQKAYSVASVADKVYLSPQGYLEWTGYSVDYAFLKGTFEKLQIEPQVFYAGKFKNATEPFRSDRMTPENELQTAAWMNDLYGSLLMSTAEARKIDTATLHQLANEAKIQTAADAAQYKLVDGVRYDDEVKDEIRDRLDIDKFDKIHFVTISKYFAASNLEKSTGEKIALIYAEGDIVDGKGEQKGIISSDHYRSLIRKARLDQSVKAIVFRVNSGGGSSLASETIWREISLAKKEKPVIVSFGDVAASGGYYISCAADSIFASPVTLTGSIGVFGIIPNMQQFFNQKLGVTFDGVKTGPYADAGEVHRPMNADEKKLVQAQVDLIYKQFKERVAVGRNRDTSYVETIAQGRIWTGAKAREIGLIDRFGGLDDAIASAALKAGLKDYVVKEYPETKNLLEQVFGKSDPLNYTERIREEMGEENFNLFMEVKKIRQWSGTVQARLPFQYFIR